MLETIEENNARIEDLEGQLESQLYQMKILIQDMTVMDEHYNSIFYKCQRALDKLEKRKKEVEGLNRVIYYF